MERFKESRLVFPLQSQDDDTGHYWQNMLWQTLWTWYCHFMRFFITYLQTMMIRITERLNQSEVRSKLPSDTKLLPIFKTIQPGCRFIIAPQVFSSNKLSVGTLRLETVTTKPSANLKPPWFCFVVEEEAPYGKTEDHWFSLGFSSLWW